MIKKCNIAIIILFFCHGIVFSRTGYLRVDCPVPGLKVMVNDSTVGITPLGIIQLKNGNYRLTVQNPRRGVWRNDDWQQQIKIAPNDTLAVTPRFPKHRILRSQPFSAQVFCNGDLLGTTPLLLDLSTINCQTLILKKDNYKPLHLRLNELTTSSVTLQPLHVKSAPEPEIRRQKILSYTLLALTISSGFASVYLKNQADQKYEQYLTAGDITTMNKYFNEARNYDKLSGIAFGMFEINFVLLFYSLMIR